MRLIIDVGNTRLKWILVEEKGNYLKTPKQMALTHCHDFKNCLSKVGEQIKSEFPKIEITSISIAAVSGDKKQIEAQCLNNWSVVPRFVEAEAEARGVKNAYDNPKSIGVDRWAAMVEAYCQAQSAVCVFDLGSAFTIDAVNNSGHHLGGYILPGMSMMRDSVTGNTSNVKVNEAESNSKSIIWGRNTDTAVKNGVLYTVVTLIESTIKNLRADTQMPVEAFLTGGDSNWVLPFIEGLVTYDEQLVIKGIWRLSSG